MSRTLDLRRQLGRTLNRYVYVNVNVGQSVCVLGAFITTHYFASSLRASLIYIIYPYIQKNTIHTSQAL